MSADASQTKAKKHGMMTRHPWLVPTAAAAGALVPALLLDDGSSFIGVAAGAAVYAAWAAWRNSPARQEPFTGDGYAGSWTSHPDYEQPPVLFLRVDLDSGEYCMMPSRLQSNAGALKLSSPGLTDNGALTSERGVGEKVHRVRHARGGTILSATRTGSDTFAMTIGSEEFPITADKKTEPAATAAQIAALTEHLPPATRVVAIAYAGSQQFMWL